MKDIKIKDIINITGGKLILGNEEEICENFSNDTRNIKKGDTYIGLQGEKFDGSKFWKEAIKNGAKTIIVQNIDLTLFLYSFYPFLSYKPFLSFFIHNF